MPLRQTEAPPENKLAQTRRVAAATGISLAEHLRRAPAVQLAYERALDVPAAYDRGVEAGSQTERERS